MVLDCMYVCSHLKQLKQQKRGLTDRALSQQQKNMTMVVILQQGQDEVNHYIFNVTDSNNGMILLLLPLLLEGMGYVV